MEIPVTNSADNQENKIQLPPLPTKANIESPKVQVPKDKIEFPELPEGEGGTSPIQMNKPLTIKDYFETAQESEGFNYERYSNIPLPLSSGVNQSRNTDLSGFHSLIEMNGVTEIERLQNAQTLANSMGVSPKWAYENQEAAIESFMGAPKSTREFFQIAKQASQSWMFTKQIAAIAGDMRLNGYDPEKAAKIKEIQSQMPNYEDLLTTLPRKVTARTMEMMPQMAENYMNAGITGAITGIGVAILFNLLVGAGTGGSGLSVSLPATGVAIGSAAAAGTAAASVAGTAAAALNTAEIEANLAYADFLDDIEGGMNEDIAKFAAGTIGVLNGAIEVSQMDVLVKSFGGKAFQKALNKEISGAIADGTIKKAILNNPTIRKYLTKAAANPLGEAGLAAGKLIGREVQYIAPEVAEEIAQEITNIAFSNLGRRVNNKLYGTDFDLINLDEAKARVAETAKSSVLAFLGMGIGPVINTAVDIKHGNIVNLETEEQEISRSDADDDFQEITQPAENIDTENEIPIVDKRDINPKTGEVQGDIRADKIRSGMLEEEISTLQTDIDIKQKEIDSLLKNEESESPAVLTARSELSELQNEMGSLQGERQILSDISKKQIWELSRDEFSYLNKLSDNLLSEHLVKKFGGETVGRAAVKEILNGIFPGFDDNNIDTTYGIAQVIAGDAGMRTEQYLNETVAPELYSRKKDNAAQVLAEYGEALSRAIRKGDQDAVTNTISRLLDSFEFKDAAEARAQLQEIASENPEYIKKVEADNRQAIGEFKARLQSSAGMSSEESNIVGELIGARAEAEGQSVRTYIRKTFANIQTGLTENAIKEAVKKGRTPRAAVEFLEDGRAILQITEKSDLSSLIHELGHILRKQLSPEELAKIEKYFGVENGEWTDEAEERFAVSFEEYIRRGIAPRNDLKNIFQKLAEMLGRLYEGIRNQLQFPPEVIEVMDGLFNRDRIKSFSLKEEPEPERILFHDEDRAKYEGIFQVDANEDNLYFEIPAGAENVKVIPLDRVILREAADPERIMTAAERMNASAEGIGPKRAPIKVFNRGDGYYTVFDGNTTTTILKTWGEENVIAEEIPLRQAESFLTVADARAAAEKEIYSFNKLVEELGAVTGAVNTKLRKEVKKVERATDKIIEYQEDNDSTFKEAISNIVDWNGGTLTYHTVDDVYAALEKVKANSQVVRIKDRIKMPANGYRDILLNVKTESGHIAELQLRVDAMLEAKSSPLGHGIYKIIRAIDSLKDKTERLAETANALSDMQKAFYDLIFEADEKRLVNSIASSSEIYIPISLIVSSFDGEGVNSTNLSDLSLKYERLASSSTYGRSSASINFGDFSSLRYESGNSFDSILASINSITRKFNDIKNSDKGILFQDDEQTSQILEKQYKSFIQNAVEEGRPVPEEILQQYAGESWADEAIENIERSDKEKQLIAFPWLTDEARKYRTWEDFAEFVKTLYLFADEDPTEEDVQLAEAMVMLSPEEESAWFRDFWEAANKKTIKQKNRDFVQDIQSDKYIEALLRSIAADQSIGMGQELHGSLWAGVRQLQANGGIKQSTIERIRKVLENNPEKYRKAFAVMSNDPELIQGIEAEEAEVAQIAEREELEKELEALNPTRRLEIADLIEDEKLKKKILKGEITIEQIEEDNRRLEDQLNQADKKIFKLEEELNEDIRKFSRQEKYLEKINSQIAEQDKEIRRLTNELTKSAKLTEAEKQKKIKARQDARDKINDLKQQQKRDEVEIRAKAIAKVKVNREADYKRLQRYKDERRHKDSLLRVQRQLREYKERLLKKIMRPAGAKIQVEYRREIDELQLPYRQLIELIQRSIDPKFRSKKSMWRKEQSRSFFLRNPEANSALPEGTRKRIFAKTANELSINELETLSASIDRLRTIGSKKQLLHDAAIRAGRVGSAHQATQEALNGNIQHNEHYLGGKDRDIQLKNTPWEVWQKMTLRPTRILQLLGGDKKGILYKIFVDRVNEKTDEYLKNSGERRDSGFAKMKELGIKMSDLGKIVDSWDEIKRDSRRGADGKIKITERKVKHVVTLDDAIHYYIGVKNQKNYLALRWGNGIPDEVLKRNIDNLTDNQKAWGEYLLDDFSGENFTRLKTAFEESTNQAIEQIDFYFPMNRLDLDQDFYGDRFAAELSHRQGLSRGYIGKGWGNERINIPEKYQAPIRTGATMVWLNQMEAQEHYIAFADQIKDMHYISGWRDLQQAIRQQHGQIYNDWLKKYINDIAVPNMYRTNLEIDKISRLLRHNTAVAYLAFNATTMLKQLPSVALYLADSGPGYLISAAAQFAAHPFQTVKYCTDRDPQLKHRAINRAMEELKLKDEESYNKLKSRLGTIGTFGIRTMDQVATAIGWKAVYDKNIKQGKSEAEAIRAAQEATLRTQPAGAGKDLAELYRSAEAWNWFTMFSNQLNQYWNIITYDIPQAIQQKQYMHAIADITAIGISAVVIALISDGIPEDEDEWKKLISGGLIKQLINSIPIIGKNVVSGYEGFFSTGADPLPMAESAGKIIKGIEQQRGMEYYAETLIEGLAPLAGLPVLGLYKRPKRAIEEENIGALIGWYREDSSSRGGINRRSRSRRTNTRRR